MSLHSVVRNLPNPLQFLLRLPTNWGRALVLAIAALICSFLVLTFSNSLQTLEEQLGALGWTLSPNAQIEQRITLVTIDEKSLAEIGPWPWSRAQMAELVSAIDAAGAQLQIHDVFYPEAKPGDDELLASMQAAQGVVLAQVPVLQSDQSVRVGTMSHALTGVGCNAVGSQISLATTQNFIASHGLFTAIPKGHISLLVDSDGAMRKFPAVVCVDGAAYPPLSISALLQATTAQWGASVSAGESLFGPSQVLQLSAFPGLDIPLDSDGNIRISYKQSPANFQAISASDVIAGRFDSDILDNTWALVGGTALSMGDIVPTPYSGATVGLELQARILGSMLDAQIPYTPRSASWLLGLLVVGFAGILMVVANAHGRVSAYGLPVAAVLLPVVALSLHMQLLSSNEIWLGWLSPALYSLLAASLLLLLEQARVRSERTRVFGNLSSYLPSDMAKEIAYSLPTSAIHAKRCDFTMLSADLRNFAAFGEARPPEESAAVLHYFFVSATEIIERHGGTVHEFKGDSLLAIWDGAHQAAAEQALQAALEMQASIDWDSFPLQSTSGLEPLAIGIGIEQGPALIGSIGPAHRRSHSLLGDTVTITLRIQELTAELAQPILIGECAGRQLSNHKLESQGSFLLTGLRIPHTLFAPAIHDVLVRSSKRQPPALKVVSARRD